MKTRLTYAGVAAAAAVLGVLCWLIPGQANALALLTGSGPYYPQGTIVDLCVGTSGTALDHVYAEAGRDAGVLGSCGAGYTQLPTVSDPGGYVIPAGSSSGDVVTVTYPGDQTSTEGVAIADVDMAASSNQGHTISWSAASSPAGLFGSGELAINPATGVISGTPTGITGTYTVTVTATDSAGTQGTTTFTWTINP
jgi:Putative Ig domain